MIGLRRRLFLLALLLIEFGLREEILDQISIGLFEGAGYTGTGMYRSGLHCVMGAGGLAYCKACQDAIKNVVEEYCN